MTKNTKDNWGRKEFLVENKNTVPFKVTVSGRERWALECLKAAGPKGCTPIDHPGPRWSAYVFDLRGMGVQIETMNEPHKGPFPGSHARYVLQSNVTASTQKVAKEGAVQ